MNAFEFVLAIVFLVFLGKAVRAYFCSRNERRDTPRNERDEEDVQLEQLARLEERIRVLERIVTDDPPDLKPRSRRP